MIHVGFTGTRSGMSPEQIATVRRVLVALDHASEREKLACHHGDCVGADAEFHALARELGARITVHPPVDESDRAWCPGDEMLPALPYMKRNKQIVLASEFVVAAPYTDAPVGRHPGGTWKTVEIARKERRTTALVLRDGTINARDLPSWLRVALDLGYP